MVTKVDGYDLFEGHTPGPWRWNKDYWGNYQELIGDHFASVSKAEDYYSDISDVDAALIAAAPDLLAERDQLWEALEAGYMIVHGKAHIRSNKDVPMSISDAKRERLIRKALMGWPCG